MTLGIAITSTRYAAVITDRRLSGGRLTDDSNKSGSVVYRDGRLAFTYAGLAETSSWQARSWIPEQLARAAAPGVGVETAIKNFAERMTDEFRKVRLPARYGASTRRLSVALTGFRLTPFGQLVPVIYLVSNYQGAGEDAPKVWDDFRLWGATSKPGECGMLVVGDLPNRAHFDPLGNLISTPEVPSHQVINKAVMLIRELNEKNPNGSVGRSCSSLVVPPNATAPTAMDYHPDEMATRTPASSYVCAKYGDEGAYMMVDASFEPTDGNGLALAHWVPTAAQNRPCPCGSKKRYRHCHGGATPPSVVAEGFTVSTKFRGFAKPADGTGFTLMGMTAAGLMLGGPA